MIPFVVFYVKKDNDDITNKVYISHIIYKQGSMNWLKVL